MGALDRERIAYPDPDPGKIFNKIMNWLQSNYQTVMQDRAESQLADDYMKGWDADNAFEGKQLGLLAAKGQIDPEDLQEVTRLSMLRGVEEWDMMLACARSLQSRRADQKSLDGQDTLSYIAKLWKPAQAGPLEEGSQVDRQAYHGAASNTPQLGPDSSRPPKKKRKRRNTESHYFAEANPAAPAATTGPPPLQQQQEEEEEDGDGKDDKSEEDDGPSAEQKLRKKAKNAARRRNRKARRDLRQQQQTGTRVEGGQLRTPTYTAQEPLPLIPVLKEAVVWYRSDGNTKTTDKATADEHDAEESILSPQGGGAATTADLKENHS